METIVLKARYGYLDFGDKGDAVGYLQEDLIRFNCYQGIVINKEFDALTEMSVKLFQSKHNLVMDGIVGPLTIDVINSLLKPVDINVKLNDLMAKYEKEFSYLRIDMSAYNLVNRLTIFYNLVKNRGPLDLKNVKGWQSINFIYNYEYLANDAPGNILYGYVGKVFGFSDLTLLSAAGFAQVAAGTSNEEWKNLQNFGDDPRDQARIKQGIEIFNKAH